MWGVRQARGKRGACKRTLLAVGVRVAACKSEQLSLLPVAQKMAEWGRGTSREPGHAGLAKCGMQNHAQRPGSVVSIRLLLHEQRNLTAG